MSVSAQPKQAQPEQADPAPSTRDTDWRQALAAILENRAKKEGGPGPARTNGFAVVLPNTDDLRPVQEHLGQLTWNDSAVLRVRIGRPPVFGTLLAAFLGALNDQRSSPPVVTRNVDVRLAGQWEWVFGEGWLADVASDPRSPLGSDTHTLDPEWLDQFLAALGDESHVRTGMRLVLLCELADPKVLSQQETAVAWAQVVRRLPERVGLVLANAVVDPSLLVPPHGLELVVPPDYAPPRAETTRFTPAALRSDRPSRVDRLGVRPYAEALASFLLLPQTTPLTMGIHGPWGKGKSSFMEMVERELVGQALVGRSDRTRPDELLQLERLEAQLEQEASPSEELQRRRDEQWERVRRAAFDDVVTVDFNAWRYQDSTQIWAGLASTITEELESALPRRSRWWMPFSYGLRNRRLELAVDLMLPVLALLTAAAVAAILGADALREALPNDLVANVIAAVGAGALAVWAAASRIYRTLEPVSARLLTYVRRPDYRDRMGYQHVVLDDVRFVHERLKAKRRDTRVVVFIDDLDRCAPDKIMEILQAVNLILGESEFFVFLGIDTRMIERAIEQHYRDETDGQELPTEFATTYLRKIVQLNFHLPAASPLERSSYVAGLFSTAAQPGKRKREDREPEPVEGVLRWDLGALDELDRGVPTVVEDTREELETFERFRDFVTDNPRELKRLVNVHRLVKILLQREGAGNEEEQQRKLVKWLIFCAGCPDLVDDVICHAQRQRESTNAIAETGAAQGLGDVARFAALEPVLTGEDLADEHWLPRAAAISQLVRRD